MIEIRSLTELPAEALSQEDTRYTSTEKYVAHKTEDSQRTVISLELTPLDAPYIKQYLSKDDEEMQRYQQYAREGHSLGAYDGDTLVGLALTEARWWNRTLWLWEFYVAATHRRQGIGRRLMEALAEKARQAGFRVITLETQNTNAPAIAFYRSAGFEIESIDLSFYTNHDVTDGEVAIFMKRKLA